MTLLTTHEAADMARVEVRKIRELINAREITAINVGGVGSQAKYRIRDTDFHAWLESRKVA